MKGSWFRISVIAVFLLTTYSLQLTTALFAQEEFLASRKEDVKKYISMLKSAREEDREEAAEALAEIADPSSVEPLMQALANDKDPYVRESAAFALGEIGDRRAAGILLTALKNDGDAYVRESAAYSLGIVGDSSILSELQAIANRENEVFVQDAIKDAIIEIKTLEVQPIEY
ncbi:MAG: HEAT repeat domain-containing protein [Candidatus Omnitrophota bacterium]